MRNYDISVPVISSNIERSGGREKLAAELKRMGAKRIFLALGVLKTHPAERKKEFSTLAENCRYFKEQGFEVGSWMWTFWYDGNENFTDMHGADGSVNKNFACPLDEAHTRFTCQCIKEIAGCGVDMIMFDDDFRLGFFGSGIFCTCELHMKKIREMLGEDISPSELMKKAISGGANKYRNAWMKANGNSLAQFAKRCREALDEVNPEIRMGPCSCMTVWDNDGIDSIALSKLLAGKTKPFLRLIGAPYWAVNQSWGNRLAHVIELERMEAAWCRKAMGEGIEIFSEGDSCPRPRVNCPASYVEIFDTALRADGSLDGILKYAIDYHSTLDYEKGYVNAHCRNTQACEKIHKIFSGKQDCGVRIHEAQNKLADMKIPSKVENSHKIEEIFFSPAARMLANCSIPSSYTAENSCSVAFGENIRYVPETDFQKGIIIDMAAAQILMEKGIDVGITRVIGQTKCSEEHFLCFNEYDRIGGKADVFELEINSRAQTLSTFEFLSKTHSGENSHSPACFIYKNARGHRFAVFAFEAYFNCESLIQSYARSKQLSLIVQKLTEKPLPACCFGNPYLYLMCKKNENSMAVGLWNIFADPITNPVVELDEEYVAAEFVNCNGVIEGKNVLLSEIAPFGFAAFEVRKK